jgi:hypothetical protein
MKRNAATEWLTRASLVHLAPILSDTFYQQLSIPSDLFYVVLRNVFFFIVISIFILFTPYFFNPFKHSPTPLHRLLFLRLTPLYTPFRAVGPILRSPLSPFFFFLPIASSPTRDYAKTFEKIKGKRPRGPVHLFFSSARDRLVRLFVFVSLLLS